MRRIKTTIIAIVAIIILMFMIAQTSNVGAPWIFTIVVIFMIILICANVIRVWLRGY